MSVINNLKINIHRHSEGNVMTEESTAMYSDVMDPSVGYASLKDDNRAGQRGRSMVEMLGVLAIVGVLSVGGVYGYGVAMKKHKANEALHKASLMATTISSYAMSNNGNLPTPNSDFANFGYETALTDKGTQFDLMVKGIGFDVCTQMKNSKGGMVRDVDCDEATGDATITYYKNLATDPAEGEKSPTGGNSFNPDGATEDDGSDCSADTKLGSECQVCIKGSYQDSDAKCDSGQICVDGMCKTPATGTGCLKNSDCDTIDPTNCSGGKCFCGYYVEGGIGSSSNANCETGPKAANGTCLVTADYRTPVDADTDGITGILSAKAMDWFSAKNFCQAVGGSMISLKGSGIDKSKVESSIEENGYCEGSDCAGVDWDKYKANLSKKYWWIKDWTEDSCYAFYVDNVGSIVGTGDRGFDTNYALCE